MKMTLFEDDRFLFDLNDRQKGLYLMLLGLAGKTDNKIRNEQRFIQTRLALEDLDMNDLRTISEIFPKFKLHNDYWVFEDFQTEHNQIRLDQGEPKASPKLAPGLDQNRIEENRIEKNIQSRTSPPARAKRATVPTKEEIINFFNAECPGNTDQAHQMYDYFASNGWKVGGRAPMKDWQAAARNWIRRANLQPKGVEAASTYDKPWKEWKNQERAEPPEEFKKLAQDIGKANEEKSQQAG